MKITTPVSEQVIQKLQVNDTLEISGVIYCGRDAVLPKIVKALQEGAWDQERIPLNGYAVFHTAVSPAGIGPTSSNKLDIEESIPALSRAGVRLHIGKGSLKPETVEALKKYHAVFLVTPPNTALLTSKIQKQEVAAYPEEGMEAFYRLEVVDFPAIVAIAQGKSIFDRKGRMEL